MQKVKNLSLRGFIVLISTYLMSFSYALYFTANLGSDSVTLLVDGVSSRFSILYGTASNLVNLLMFAVVLLFNRKIIGFATICCAFLTGTFLQINVELLSALSQGQGFALWVRILMPLVACVMNAAGIGLYLTMNLGASPFDGTVLTLARLPMFNYKTAMYAVNIFMFIAGVFFGGVWGYGTVVAVASSGFLFEKMLKFMQAKFGTLAKKENEPHEV